MKELKLKVLINRTVEEVSEFTTNPNNTHKWIESISREISTEYPPKLGSIYKNFDSDGNVNEYTVTQFIKNKISQLDATRTDYKVKYTYAVKSNSETELEYFEWSQSDKLQSPFTQDILDKLKRIIEVNN